MARISHICRLLALVAGGLTIPLLGVTSVVAADFTRNCTPSKGDPSRNHCNVKMTGSIQPGDANRLETFLFRKENRDLVAIGWIVLDSPGGDVNEAIQLASVMRRWSAAATNQAAGGKV